MNPAVWRSFVRQPGGIATILLLVLLLALSGQSCPMPAFANFAPSSAARDCCHRSLATADAPADPVSCHEGSCLQAPDHRGIGPGSLVGQLDWPASLLAAISLPPDWLGDMRPLPFPAVHPAARPPPLQRSRVLRL
ncbi:MAG: hypothetical protein P9E67_05475 [Candidatus Competibacter sp.]|nr:hypothetical protein [Candidatus Competibacter sp.]